MQKSNPTSLFETIGDMLRPFNAPPQDTEKKYCFEPEAELVIWQCKNCECDCAGENKSGLCASCESITGYCDDTDDDRYFANEDRIEADNRGYEINREYSNLH
jgi:hypothetical protein